MGQLKIRFSEQIDTPGQDISQLEQLGTFCGSTLLVGPRCRRCSHSNLEKRRGKTAWYQGRRLVWTLHWRGQESHDSPRQPPGLKGQYERVGRRTKCCVRRTFSAPLPAF